MNQKFVLLVSAVAALGGLLFGFDTAIISGAIPYITPYFNLDAYSLGWTVSSILIGCAAGALVAGMLADAYGRRPVLIGCALLFAISGIGVALSHHLYIFVLFRVAGGLGVGAAAMVSPMYIAELAPAAWRGRLVAFYQLAIVMGILLAYLSNYAFSRMGEDSWRWMFGSQVLPSILFWTMLLLVPETPRWLIKKGRRPAAEQILLKTSGASSVREGTSSVQQEIAEIDRSFHHQGNFSGAPFGKTYGPVLIMGILVAVFQQVTGINAILYYAPVIFKETGLDQSSALFQTIGIGVVNVASTFIAIGLVDKLGRKKLLLAGSLLMGLSLGGVALCFHYRYFDHYLVLICMLIYVGSFGCTLGAVTWVYLSEVFPNRIRGLALSVATLSLWLADFIVTCTFPVMATRLGTASTLLVYAILCAVAFCYMLFYVKETKGRSWKK